MSTEIKFSKQTFEDQLIAFYLEWLNGWLTIEKMAEYYSISELDCLQRIETGRKTHEARLAKNKVAEELTVYEQDGKYDLYNEAGQAVEMDFDTEKEAIQWANDNGFKVVVLFPRES